MHRECECYKIRIKGKVGWRRQREWTFIVNPYLCETLGIFVLEQANMLVREDMGEHDQDGDRHCISATGSAGSDEMSMNILNELRCTDRGCLQVVVMEVDEYAEVGKRSENREVVSRLVYI